MSIGASTARVLALACALGFTSVASAQTGHGSDASHASTEDDRDQARRFALEGVTASNHSDWATALDKFQHAEALYHAPIHLRYMAIAYERTNHILEAALTWRRLTHEVLAADAPEPFRAAVAEATREYPRLRGRLGEITLTITNPPVDARIELDGRTLEPLTAASPILVEAGPHHISAHGTGQPNIERSINVGVGGSETVVLPFAAPHVAEVAVPVPVPEATPHTTTVYTANPLRLVGIIGAGVGGALLLGGVISGVMAGSADSSLMTMCPNSQCPTQAAFNQVSTVNSDARTTNILLITGGILAVAGTIVAIVSGPRAETVQVASGPFGSELAVHF